MIPTEDLPPSTSPHLDLLHPTEQEKTTIWRMNGQEWRGALSVEQYVRRERHLSNQALTRHGGIIFWLLTDTTKPPNARPILSSCESIRRKAFVKRQDGKIEESISHGIESVFCDPVYRGRGYGKRMAQELGRKLDTWGQEDGRRTDFSVLYSDIGKVFYAKSGWHAFDSSHISLSTTNATQSSHHSIPKALFAEDLAELCKIDEEMLRKSLERPRRESRNIQVALIPDVEAMQWLHAREEFVSNEISGRVPKIKGAYVQCSDGRQVWCIWCRFFGNASTSGNTFYILRMVLEGEEPTVSIASENKMTDEVHGNVTDEQIDAVASMLRAAQKEGLEWGMNDVQVWNPSPAVVKAARQIDQSSGVVHRDMDSIACLKWHGVDSGEAPLVEWIANEKYGW